MFAYIHEKRASLLLLLVLTAAIFALRTPRIWLGGGGEVV
jgi:hypothetical protein